MTIGLGSSLLTSTALGGCHLLGLALYGLSGLVALLRLHSIDGLVVALARIAILRWFLMGGMALSVGLGLMSVGKGG